MLPPIVPGRLRLSSKIAKTSTRASLKESEPPNSTQQHSIVTKLPAISSKKSAKKTPSNFARTVSHNRSTSQQVIPTTGATKTKSSIQAINDRRASLRPSKPAFAAYKQHYTPSKTSVSKPPISSTVTSSSSGHSTPNAEMSNNSRSKSSGLIPPAQMTELIYLHLLHSSAEPNLSAWRKSAERQLAARFNDLRCRHVEIAAIAQEQQGLLNAIALAEWGSGVPSILIGERVSSLSKNIAELEAMIEPEGRFGKVRQTWEIWFATSDGVRDERKRSDSIQKKSLVLVEGIGDGWKAEAMVLERELGYVQRELSQLTDGRVGSGLGKLLQLGKSLVKGLLEELDVMQWIEAEVKREDEQWIESIVSELGQVVTESVTI